MTDQRIKLIAKREKRMLHKEFTGGIDQVEFSRFLLGCGLEEVGRDLFSTKDGNLLVTKMSKILIISTDGARCENHLTDQDLNIIFKAFQGGATILLPITFLLEPPHSTAARCFSRKKDKFDRRDFLQVHTVVLKIKNSFEWTIFDANNFPTSISFVIVKKREKLIKERVRKDLQRKGMPIPEKLKISWISKSVSYFNVPDSCAIYACWIVEQEVSNLGDVDFGANGHLQTLLMDKILASLDQRIIWNKEKQTLLEEVARGVQTCPIKIFTQKLEAEGRQNEILEKSTERKLSLRKPRVSQRSQFRVDSATKMIWPDGKILKVVLTRVI